MIPSLRLPNTVNVAVLKWSGSRGKRCGMPSFVVAGPRAAPTTSSSSSSSSVSMAEQLRMQLDQLQAEAEATRSKANSTRLRLLRLSEASEKLHRQAALEIENGKENEARELLLKKKKLMQALDRSKSRIELLDKFSAKLNEAISLKETQLIGNLTVLSVVNAADADQPIHIISPRDDVDDGSKESGFVDSSILKLGEIEEMESHNFQADIPGETLRTVYEEARISYVDGTDKMNFLKDISSFDNFLEHIDGHLREIETDIVTLVKLSTLVMENEQQQKSLKDQQALQVLKDICSIRRRIESIIQSKTEET